MYVLGLNDKTYLVKGNCRCLHTSTSIHCAKKFKSIEKAQAYMMKNNLWNWRIIAYRKEIYDYR